jgi:hypothetical protein
MGKIENIKTLDDHRIFLNLVVSSKQLNWLKGNLLKMHVFSEENLEHKTRLIKRGKRESTKYFLLPKGLRDGVVPSGEVNCNMIETEERHIFIFAVPKYNF